MEAKEYLEKVREICETYELAECCASDQCPLYQYDCGIPKEEKDIAEAVEFVKTFDLKTMPGLCKVCGYNLESKELQGHVVNYCPICGTKVEKAPDSVASTEQGQI